MPIQQMLLGVGAKKKTYIDDVFSTYLWIGSGSARSINTGVDMTEGGLTWIRRRNQATDHYIYDTVSGATKYLASNDSMAQQTDTATLTAFNNNGFSLGTNGGVNGNGNDFVGWSFRKAPGFFDVVTWTGNNTNRTIAHNLGCVPGCIMVKRTDASYDWRVYHVGNADSNNAAHYFLELNNTDAKGDSSNRWQDTLPTSTHFSIGDNSGVNYPGGEYVAYVFAGGESTAATAVSVNFNGSSQYLSIPDSTDYEFGSGDFTVECWLKADSFGNKNGLVSKHYGGYSSWRILTDGSGASSTFKFIWMDSNGNENTVTGGTVYRGQWTHVAVSRSGNTIRMFVNGLSNGDVSFNNTIRDGDVAVLIGTEYIGSAHANQYYFDGQISNVRIVKGTGVYTSSFKPSTTALTSITNTKLLCCQSSTVTTATTITGSITNNSATASTDSPFDDPSGFVFGDAGDQNVIKNGSMKLDSSGRTTVNLGFEPQWLMWKKTSGTGGWGIYDAMRGVVTGSGDQFLIANDTNAESTTGNDALNFTPTGFEVYLSAHGNADFIFTAIRRSDGYVGKPPELGTDVFAMDTGNSSSDGPAFDSNFAVDFALLQQPASSGLDWRSFARLTGTQSLATNTTASESAESNNTSDYNDGFADSYTNVWQSWLWKRGAGFDVVTYKGDGVANRQIAHSLNAVPQMIWVKRRDTTANWRAYHVGLNNGSNPQDYALRLNTNDAQGSLTDYWGNTALTSSHFQVGNATDVNASGSDYIAMLFSSVSGISKCGYYSGSSSAQTISLGFQPRFVIIKATNSAQNWIVLDTVRGWGSGADQFLQLDHNDSQSGQNLGAPTSTGMSLDGDIGRTNYPDINYVYYAHA